MLIDLHNHTMIKSDDSFLRPEELVRRAKELGLDGIAFTDHDIFWDLDEIARLSKELDFPIFPGVEINTEDGHVLCWGLDRYVFGMHHISFVYNMVQAAHGAMIMAHSYRRQLPSVVTEHSVDYYVERMGDKPHYDYVDALEVYNGRGMSRENEFSYKVALRRGKPMVAGSDAHTLSDVATVATDFEREIRTVPELITELRAGRYKPVVLRDPERRAPQIEGLAIPVGLRR
jgi:predicted metal-dependent phosphoesterase TrpH